VPRIGGLLSKNPVKRQAPALKLSTIKEQPSRKKENASPLLKASPPKQSKGPSKYMKEVLRLQWLDFIKDYDKLQT